jgi:hypothetical protein
MPHQPRPDTTRPPRSHGSFKIDANKDVSKSKKTTIRERFPVYDLERKVLQEYLKVIYHLSEIEIDVRLPTSPGEMSLRG